MVKAFFALLFLGLSLGLGIVIVRAFRTVDMHSIYVGLDGLRTPIMVGATILLALIGFLVWFRPRPKSIALTAACIVTLGLLGNSLFRIESFYGNMIPRLTWRWTPTAEEQIAQYLSDITPVSRGELIVKNHPLSEQDFTGFLGNDRDGVIRGIKLPENFAQQAQTLWRHPVGLGWSGFAVAGNQAITQEQRGNTEAIVCYDLRSGKQIWQYDDNVRFCDEHGDGPRTTPSITENRVFCMGATGVLTCVDRHTGKFYWRQETLSKPEEQNLLWGMSGSTLLMDDLVIVTPGAGANEAIKAYRQDSGELVWSHGNDTAAYASPVTATIAGERQILSFNGAGLRGYSEQGKELWLFPWLTQGESQRVNVAQPIVVSPIGLEKKDQSYILVSSGYGVGMALLRVTRNDGTWDVSEVWKSNQLKSKLSNFVVRDQFIFGLDNGILTCLSLADGAKCWKQGRYGHGQMLLVGDKLLIQAESGEVILVAANPTEFQELGRFEALSDKTWNHAALAGSILVVRNDREAAAYELSCSVMD